MGELGTSGRPSFSGKYGQFTDVLFEPRPVQKPHPPIWVGGHSKAALRRTARFGAAWHPINRPPEELRAGPGGVPPPRPPLGPGPPPPPPLRPHLPLPRAGETAPPPPPPPRARGAAP